MLKKSRKRKTLCQPHWNARNVRTATRTKGGRCCEIRWKRNQMEKKCSLSANSIANRSVATGKIILFKSLQKKKCFAC